MNHHTPRPGPTTSYLPASYRPVKLDVPATPSTTRRAVIWDIAPLLIVAAVLIPLVYAAVLAAILAHLS